MSRKRYDLPKYRSQLLKYAVIIYEAQERKEDFYVTSPWSFYIMGAEDRIIAEANFGWSGIIGENPSPTISELIVCLEDPGLLEIVQKKIGNLYDGYPWLPVLPVRYLHPNEYFEEHRLPDIDGWYDPDTGRFTSLRLFNRPTACLDLKVVVESYKTVIIFMGTHSLSLNQNMQVMFAKLAYAVDNIWTYMNRTIRLEV